MAATESSLPPNKPRRGRPRREPTLTIPPSGEAQMLSPAPAAPEVPPPPPPPPPKQTAEVAQVEVRHGMPVYIASQRKLIYPNHVYPVIVDRWVEQQLRLPNGALRRV